MNLHEAIALLTEELDPATVADLIGQFLADTPLQIHASREAFTLGDLATAARVAHSLAGSSSTFGLKEIQSAARTLEGAALAGNGAAIPGLLEELTAAYARAVPLLKRIIQQ